MYPREPTPRRIFLDTGVVQCLSDCGDFIFGEEDFPENVNPSLSATPQVLKRPDARNLLWSLRFIFAFDERAHFDWIVSNQLIAEVDGPAFSSASEYVREILMHSMHCLNDDPPSEEAKERSALLSKTKTPNISHKDKILLQNAIEADCDHFLTLEKRLPTQSAFIAKFAPIRICTAPALHEALLPHLKGL